MNAGNTDVVKLIHPVAHHSRGEQSFFGDRNIAGTCRNNEDQPFACNFVAALDSDDARERMEFRGARIFAVCFFHGGEDFGVGAGDEDVVARVFFLEHGADDFSDLLWSLAFGENDFRKALAKGAVMVNFGEAEILEGQVLETFNGRARREFSGLHGFQNFQQFRLIHAIQPLEILSLARGIAAP